MTTKRISRPRRTVVATLGIVAAAFGLTLLPAQAASPEAAQRNKAIVQEKFDAWAAGTGGPFELLADDARWTIEGHSLASKTYPSREAFMSEVIRPFNARMQAGIKPSIRNIYADGDGVVIFFDARGTARDGKPYVNTYAWFFEMRAGRVIKASAFFDAIEFNDLWTRVKAE